MEYVGRVMDDGTVVKKKEKQAAAPGSSAEYELANARLKKEIGRLEKENDLLRERVKSLSNIARKNLSQAMSALDKLEDLWQRRKRKAFLPLAATGKERKAASCDIAHPHRHIHTTPGTPKKQIIMKNNPFPAGGALVSAGMLPIARPCLGAEAAAC